jgi:hypothetical protein
MNKINGYTEEEAKRLVDYVEQGKAAGKTLTKLFASYGDTHGRAKGSVRNYYYALMKNPKKDERISKLLDGRSLRVEKVREFTQEETDGALKDILSEKQKGVSIRRAIFNISDGNDKLMLRLQNKYRNVLKKEPDRIERVATELGYTDEEKERLFFRSGRVGAGRLIKERDFLQRRLESEINALYDKLTKALKEENERLRAENDMLKNAEK